MPAAARARTAICTIVSRNYFHSARTLMQSMKVVHPDWERFVLIVDDPTLNIDPTQEPMRLVSLSELSLPDPTKFMFRYNILEANTAVKPWLLEWLFERQGFDRVVYLDPDIRAFSPFEEIVSAFDRGSSMVLTPHLTEPIRDNYRPTELDILKTGTYNLGFIALARHSQINRILTWWQEHLQYDCRIAMHEGIFVDQKWMEFAPSLFDDVCILRHPGYNIAYWNLMQREVRSSADGHLVNGLPLRFFHFSGLNARDPRPLSKYQNRLRLKDVGDAGDLILAYCADLERNGLDAFGKVPYAFGRFGDGTPINDCVRQFCRSRPGVANALGENPFESGVAYFNQPWDSGEPLLTRFMQAVWETNGDARAAFPDPCGNSRAAFIRFFVDDYAIDAKVPETFVKPIRDSFDSWNGPKPKRRRLGVIRRAIHPIFKKLPTSMQEFTKRVVRRWFMVPPPAQPTKDH